LVREVDTVPRIFQPEGLMGAAAGAAGAGAPSGTGAIAIKEICSRAREREMISGVEVSRDETE
jgi:hypothetical protein